MQRRRSRHYYGASRTKSILADRTQVWAALTPDEQTALTALLRPEPEIIVEATPESAPESGKVIDSINAEKIRDIALIWWNEYYPEHTESLIAQLFSWESPGQKYGQEIINQWLQTEDELVRDRITQLFTLKNTPGMP